MIALPYVKNKGRLGFDYLKNFFVPFQKDAFKKVSDISKIDKPAKRDILRE